jgi:adenosine kinase
MAASKKFSLLCLENPLLGPSAHLLQRRILTSKPHRKHQISKQSGTYQSSIESRNNVTDNCATSDTKLLEKYGFKANDAILAEEKHLGLYEDLLNNYDAKLIAGGAAQNTARGAQVRICFYKKISSIPIRALTRTCIDPQSTLPHR